MVTRLALAFGGPVVPQRPVHHAAIVPERHVVLRPAIADLKFHLLGVLQKETKHGVALVGRQPVDPRREAAIDVERLAPGLGMGARDRMQRRGVDLALVFHATVGITSAIDMLALMYSVQPVEHRLQGVRKRIPRPVAVGEHRIAAALGQDMDLQHGAERRHLFAGYIRVPELAVGDLRSGMGMDLEHLGKAVQARCRRVKVQLAEHPADGDLRGRRDRRLFLEEQHLMVEMGLMDFCELIVGQAVGEIDAAHLRAQIGCVGPDLDMPVVAHLAHMLALGADIALGPGAGAVAVDVCHGSKPTFPRAAAQPFSARARPSPHSSCPGGFETRPPGQSLLRHRHHR